MAFTRNAHKLLLCVFTFAVFSSMTRAQSGTPAQLNDPHGDVPFGTYQVGDIDQVGVANGALDVRIPLFINHGRGLTHQRYWSYSNKSWFQDSGPFCDSSVMQCPPPTTPIWNYSDNTLGFSHVTQYPSQCGRGGFGSAKEYTGWTYVDETGTPHRFSIVVSPIQPVPTCVHQKFRGYALDGSGMIMDVGTDLIPTVTLKNGTRVKGDVGLPQFHLQDTNGNMIVPAGTDASGLLTAETDTLGRTVMPVTGTLPDGAQYEDWTTKDQSGNPQKVRIEWVRLPATTNFQQSDTLESSFSLRLARKIDLPDGLAYSFTYDTGTAPGHYGELLRIDLPSGGYIRYEYASLLPGTINSQFRGVTLRAMSVDGDSSHEKIWRYQYQQNTPVLGQNSVTITDPDGNDSVHIFSTPVVGALSNAPALEIEQRIYQGSSSTGRLLKKVSTDYEKITVNVGDGDLTEVQQFLSRPNRVTTMLDNGLVSKVETVYDPLPDNNGLISYSRSNVIERREYDFGQGAPGPLLRRTDYTYWHNSFPAYADANIVDLVQNVTVYEGAGTAVAQTQNVYDSGSIATTNNQAPKHDTNFGVAYHTRGNLTSTAGLATRPKSIGQCDDYRSGVSCP